MGRASDYICPAGTTIVGRKGSINRPVFVEEPFWNVDTAFGLVPGGGLDNKFLYYFALSYDFSRHNMGTTIPSLVKSDLVEIRMPLPPLPEQQRIVAILDEAFDALGSTRDAVAAELVEVRGAFDAFLASVFRNPVGSRGGLLKFSEIADITSALVDPRTPPYTDLPHVGGANIESQTGRLLALRTAREEKLVSGKFVFDESMVLYSKIRPYLVKAARPGFRGLCSADIYPLSPNPKVITRDFLFYLLVSKPFTDYAIQGSARAGMPKVNREHLFGYQIALPPVDEQERLTSILDSLRQEVSRAETIYSRRLALLDELKRSLLHEAFSGNL